VVSPIELAGRMVGPGHPCFIVAEAGVNHNGDITLAKRLIDAAAEAGADAVKFQTFQAERLVTATAPKARYQTRTTDGGESQLEMLRRLELSPHAHRLLADYCRQRRVLFLSTPFDEKSADLLSELGVAAFKVSSGDLTNLPLLTHVARKGKPVILSTGMSTLHEVKTAVRAVQAAGVGSLIILHCVSSYPAAAADANLRAMHTMAAALKLPVGYSDHTMGIEVALGAAALGACVLEKHLTLDRTLPGPDQAASVEPAEFATLVHGVRLIEAALGDGRKVPTPDEREVAEVARRSLVAARHIPVGTTLTEELIAVKRPGTGLPPAMLPEVVGRRALKDIAEGTVLTRDMVA